MSTLFIVIGAVVMGLALYLAIGSHAGAPGTEAPGLRTTLQSLMFLFMGASIVMQGLAVPFALYGATVGIFFALAVATLVVTVSQRRHASLPH